MELKDKNILENLKSQKIKHYFNAPDEDKRSYFCRYGKYLTDKVHIRAENNLLIT